MTGSVAFEIQGLLGICGPSRQVVSDGSGLTVLPLDCYIASDSTASVFVLQCLSTLIPNVPYQRLKPGLLSRVVKQIRPFIQHRGNTLLVTVTIDY